MRVGDRVKLVSDDEYDHGNSMLSLGDCGIIVYVDIDDGYNVCVEWDKNIHGHKGFRNNNRDGHCWYIDIQYIKKITCNVRVLL